MKRYRLKIIFLHMIAFLAGYTSIFECYPFSVAFFAAAYASDRFRYTFFPMIVLGMTLTATAGQVIQYAVIMLLVLLVAEIMEGKRRKTNKWLQGLCAGAAVFAVAWIMGENLYIAGGEALLVASLTVLFAILMESFLITTAVDRETEIIHGPGKGKLQESAEVFRRLAGCFQELPYRQTSFSSDDRERMSRQMSRQFCANCSKCLE